MGDISIRSDRTSLAYLPGDGSAYWFRDDMPAADVVHDLAPTERAVLLARLRSIAMQIEDGAPDA